MQKYIKNSYIHCDLHNFLFCDQPGAYRRWKPQSNMLTTTVCILHHTSVVNSVCCVMPWHFLCHCHVSFVPALKPSYKDIKNAMAVGVLKYWEYNTVLPYESCSTLQGVVIVECVTVMEKWSKGKTKTFFSSTLYHKSYMKSYRIKPNSSCWEARV